MTCTHIVPEPARRQRMNLVVGLKEISLKCTYQGPDVLP
jgi:hypothetical protein